MAELDQTVRTLGALEESVFNQVRLISLDGLRRNTSYIRTQVGIPITTRSNNGVVEEISDNTVPTRIFFNKCFFISLSHGTGGLYSPLDLMKMCGFMDPVAMIDTDSPNHAICIQFLADVLNVQIQVFIGFQGNDGLWYTTPDYTAKFGEGVNIIRILNKGVHFELITTDPDVFVRDARTMTPERASQHQQQVMRLNQQYEADRRVAQELQAQLEQEEKERQRQLDEDYILALQLQDQ